LYISDDRKRLLHYALGDLAAGLFSALFGGIYELFSHEVYSFSMIYAFAVPLTGGTLLMLLLLLSEKLRCPSPMQLVLWHAGLAAFTVGLIFRGVLEIYGTTSRMIAVYPAAGSILTAAALLAYAFRKEPAPQQK